MFKPVLTASAIILALSLAACDKSGGWLNDQASAAQAYLGFDDVAPLPDDLPEATAVPILASNATGMTQDYWQDVVNADDYYGEERPDAFYKFDNIEPVFWEDDRSGWRVMEPLPYGGERYYYFHEGDDRPWFVRDPDFGYAFVAGALAIVYDSYGRPLPFEYRQNRAAHASRYFARAERLRRAARRAEHRRIEAATWRRREEFVERERDQWRGVYGRPDWRRASRGDRFTDLPPPLVVARRAEQLQQVRLARKAEARAEQDRRVAEARLAAKSRRDDKRQAATVRREDRLEQRQDRQAEKQQQVQQKQERRQERLEQKQQQVQQKQERRQDRVVQKQQKAQQKQERRQDRQTQKQQQAQQKQDRRPERLEQPQQQVAGREDIVQPPKTRRQQRLEEKEQRALKKQQQRQERLEQEQARRQERPGQQLDRGGARVEGQSRADQQAARQARQAEARAEAQARREARRAEAEAARQARQSFGGQGPGQGFGGQGRADRQDRQGAAQQQRQERQGAAQQQRQEQKAQRQEQKAKRREEKANRRKDD